MKHIDASDFDDHKQLPCGCCYVLLKKHPATGRMIVIECISEKKITESMIKTGKTIPARFLRIDPSECCYNDAVY